MQKFHRGVHVQQKTETQLPKYQSSSIKVYAILVWLKLDKCLTTDFLNKDFKASTSMQLLKFHKAYGTEFIGKRKLF